MPDAAVRKRRLLQRMLGLALVAAFGIVAYDSIWGGDQSERQIAGTLEALLSDVAVRADETPGSRDRRVQEAVTRYFTDPVTLRHADLPRTGAGQRGLLIWARLLGQFDMALITMPHLNVALLEPGRALAKADFELQASKGAESVTHRRSVELGLIKREDTWKIESLVVAPGAADQPEARP